MEVLDIDGLDIGFRRVGAGPLVVLLHGLMGSSREWRRQLDDLSDEFTVVAWDAPGCGASSDPPNGWRARDYGDCLAAFIRALGLGRPHVVGLSWGSVLALELYQRDPLLPASLVLGSAYAGWAGSLPADEVERRTRQVLRETELPPEQFVHSWIPTLLTDAAPPALVAEVMAIMSEFHPAGTGTALRAFASEDYREVLGQIRIPTLLLYGELDRRSPPSVAADMHERIPESRLVVMPDVGHLSNAENPDRFNVEVRGFIRGLVS